MIYPAFETREVTGEVLLKDRSLMELWKWAAKEGNIEAVRVGGENYAVVKDDDLAERLQADGKVKCYRYDEEKKALL